MEPIARCNSTTTYTTSSLNFGVFWRCVLSIDDWALYDLLRGVFWDYLLWPPNFFFNTHWIFNMEWIWGYSNYIIIISTTNGHAQHNTSLWNQLKRVRLRFWLAWRLVSVLKLFVFDVQHLYMCWFGLCLGFFGVWLGFPSKCLPNYLKVPLLKSRVKWLAKFFPSTVLYF